MAHTWNMELAKRDFQLGHITGCRIMRAAMTKGQWCIQFTDGPNFGYLTTARSTIDPRVFKTLDAAAKALEEIGFDPSVFRLER